MSTSTQHRKELLEVLRRQVVLWAQTDGAQRLIFARPPLENPDVPGVNIKPYKAPPLQHTGEGRSYYALTHWREAGMEMLRFPCLGCVVEGEADLTIGTTAKLNGRAASRETHHYLLSLPQQTFVLIPAGVPYPDGVKPHWERSHPERAHSRIFWLNVLPAGVLCHTCSTQGNSHTATPSFFIQDSQLSSVMELLMEELQMRSEHWEQLAQAHLLTLLLRVERGLSSRRRLPALDDPRLIAESDPVLFTTLEELGSAASTVPTQSVQRACRYIHAHLHEPLTLAGIAAIAHVSPSHLNRLFKAEYGTSVMQYVSQSRMTLAKSLLRETSLPIREISRLSGYPQASHFTHAFTRAFNVSPREFRRLEYSRGQMK